jgi:hypothetical protein
MISAGSTDVAVLRDDPDAAVFPATPFAAIGGGMLVRGIGVGLAIIEAA